MEQALGGNLSNPLQCFIAYLSKQSNVKLQLTFHMYNMFAYKSITQTIRKEFTKLPEYWRSVFFLVVVYFRASTIYFILALIKRWQPMAVAINKLFNLKSPARCYLPGRGVVISYPIEEELIVMCAMFHLSYRYLRFKSRKPLRIDMIEFLLTPASKVREFQSERNPDAVELSHSERRWRIRPNRTLKSHEVLSSMLSKITLAGASTVVLIAVPLILGGLISLFNIQVYIDKYPGCNPELEQLLRTGKISSWEPHFDWHRLVTTPFDIAELFVIWLDGACPVMMIPPFIILLNSDLLAYWKHIDVKLFHLRQLQLNRASIYWRSHEIDDLIANIRVLTSDFFELMEETNILISFILTYAVLVWLGTFAFITYVGAMHDKQINLIYRLLQFVGFIILLAISYTLTFLNRSLMVTYRLICAVIADESCSLGHKKRLRCLLEFFSGRNRAAYTLFGKIPFLPSTFLTILSWTFSCSVLFENLLKNLQVQLVQSP